MMNKKFDFLKSVRFWKLVLFGLVQALVGYGVIDSVLGNTIATVLLGDVAVNTIDRFSKKNTQ